MINDLDVRQQAIDPAHSYIVQAPAGSGKTELLMQRILMLLLTVQEPEEVMALTFTKKAVEEMRHRVIKTLAEAKAKTPITSDHQQKSRHLAEAVLAHDDKHQWHLLDSPHRLNVSTLDALCLKLCQGSPKETLLPLDVSPLDNPTEVYKQAIQKKLTDPNNQTLTEDLKTLLLHCDNQYLTVERLLCQLLAQREQWLPLVMPYYHQPEHLKHACEQVIQHITQAHIDQVLKYLPVEYIDALWESTFFSKTQCEPENHWDPLNNLLTDEPEHLSAWLYATNILLTKEGQWRSTRSINKTLGFSTDTPEEKKSCQLLLETLSNLENQENLQQALAGLRHCPPLHYDKDSWLILKSCLMCLPEIVAQCHLLFQAMNQCDYVEISLAACRVLDIDNATNKALILNHKISHILVDECQDTSLSQARLLELLTQHWDLSEHKTLFFVGDPMQSIYRFRQAEVSLFHQWQTHGLGHIALTPIQLSSNFRSEKPIVNWFNDQFKHIFPYDYAAQSGGIPYAMATAVKEASHQQPVTSYILADGDANQEAEKIIEMIHSTPEAESVAILLQKRAQALPLIQAFKEHNIVFEASDIEPLSTHPLALDWLMCLRALCHFDDQVAWYGLLRSPICGATLNTLYELSEASQQQGLLDYLLDTSIKNQPAIEHLKQNVFQLLALTADTPLWRTMEVAWHMLGFSDYYQSQAAEVIFQQCQNLLKTLQWQGYTFDANALFEALSKTYCESALSARVKLMTIHKSKGLEFDHVIIPGLQIKSRAEDKALITWQSIILENQPAQFCIAPLASKEQKQDKVYDYCRLIEKQKLAEERKRLLYVACTRAKSKLYLTCYLDRKNDKGNITEQFKPSQGSFAQMLWPYLCQETHIIEPTTIETNQKQALPQLIQPTLTWLESYKPLKAKETSQANHESNIVIANAQSLMQQSAAQHLGDALHALCELIVKEGLQTNHNHAITHIANQFSTHLINAHTLTEKLQLALTTMQHDKHAQWLFADHANKHSEWLIIEKQKFSIKKHIIDYSFVADDIRWIIDFKSATPAKGESNELFLENQLSLYQSQLDRYKKALQLLGETREIQCALYFPFCKLITKQSLSVAS